MRYDLLMLVAVLGGAWVVVALGRFAAARLQQRGEQRVRRLELLAEALRDPALDPGTRAELARALVRSQTTALGWLWQRVQNPALWRGLWFGVGWLGLLLSGAFLALGAAGTWGWRWRVEPGVFALVFSFGMLTLPLALRELARREGTARSRNG